MKKLHLSACAVAAVAALTLSACGEPAAEEGTETNSGAPVELSFWSENDSGPPLATEKQLVKDFNEAHPNIKIKYRSISNASFFTVMRNSFTSNNAPEIFQHEGNNNLFQFVTEDQVEPINDWWDKPGNGDRFAKGAPVSSVTYEDKIYGVPLGLVTTNQIYYNRTILEKEGIDPATLKTWQNFRDAFALLKSRGVVPMAFGNSEGWPGSQWFYNFLAKTAGAKKVNQLAARNCDYKWTDPDILQAAQLYTDMSKDDYFSAGKSSDDYTTATATFFSGKAAFFGAGSWIIPEIAEAPNRDDYGMIAFPMVEGGKGSATDGLISPGGLALSKNAASTPEKREAALTFLEWITQPEQQKENVKIGQISAVTAANDESLTDPLVQQVVEEQINASTGSFPFVEHVTPKAVGEDAIWQGSIGVLTGQATPESWMQRVEKAAAAEEPTIKVAEDCG